MVMDFEEALRTIQNSCNRLLSNWNHMEFDLYY